MIEIRYLQAESGANKFGTCNCCGKSSGEDPLMISVKFSYYGHGTLICLCDDCKKKLMEVLNGEQLPPASCSEFPNSSDTISRQQAIDTLRGYLVGKRCPDDGTLTCRLIENEVINKLPPAETEHIRGHWIRDRSLSEGVGMGESYGHYWKCDKCGHLEKSNGGVCGCNFCSNCGSDNREVTT